MTALKARLYEPEPPKKPERSILTLLHNRAEEKPLDWREVFPGERGGVNISLCQFKGFRNLALDGAATAGGYLRPESQPTTTIEAAQALLVCTKAGAVTVPVTEFSPIPRVISAGEGYWLLEGVAPTHANMVLGTVNPSMKTVGAACTISRLLMMMVGQLAETTVTTELLRALATKVDKAALVGSGVDGEPVGIALADGVGTTSGATFAWTTATEMLRIIEASNASPTAWVCSPTTAKILRGRGKGSAGEPVFLLGDDGRMAGLPCYPTTSMPDDKIILGDFRQMVFRSRAIEILVNPGYGLTGGGAEVVLFHYLDVIYRHPEAFCIGTSVS